MTFGAEKFQVDANEGEGCGGGGGGSGGTVWPNRPVDAKQGKSEYVDGPLLIPIHAQGSIDLVVWIHPGPSQVIYCAS